MSTGQFLYKIVENNRRNPGKVLGIVPGCGGNEKPMKNRNGIWILYTFNFLTMKHSYVDIFGNETSI
ncbi:MAG: hypothetical protein ACXACY_13380 [Candidatus Hodarchaeales archaeon]|jgi:hypothetical protein